MKRIIVNVGDLTIEEKQRVNEALAKIMNVMPCPPRSWGCPMDWESVRLMFVTSYEGGRVGSDNCVNRSPTHTVRQVLEMAGMTTQRKVRKDFDPSKEYSVDVSGCTVEEKKEVQQAFFDAGFPWKLGGKEYRCLDAVQYSNALLGRGVTAHLMYGMTTAGCNMTAKEFLELVYEPDTQGHPHAELMMQYAEDAKTHAEPWELWQIKTGSFNWIDCKISLAWDPTSEYRRKSKTHTVHGVEIPDLRVLPEIGDYYYLADPTVSELAELHKFVMRAETLRAERGLAYQNSEEGKQAAILHSKAMLGIIT